LEGLSDDIEKFREVCPKAAARSIDFLFRWVSLPPKLSGQDLRPAIYLSRESVALSYRTAGLSAKAADAVDVLLKVTSSHSQAAELAIAAMQTDDHLPVIDQLIKELRKSSDWMKVPRGFHGAVFLAKRVKIAGSRLGEYVASLPEGGVGAWIVPLLKDEEWITKLPIKKKSVVDDKKSKSPLRGH